MKIQLHKTMQKISVSFQLLFPIGFVYSMRLDPNDLVGNLIPYLKHTYVPEQYEYSSDMPIFINMVDEQKIDPNKSFIQNGITSDCQILIKLRITHK